ncbi:hypothetical protein HW090_01125 [Pseudomonas sp. ABC1]|uniref:hypothetical protein n=1 Tax=Pseudomonas sp. ABC1 TaxID=2748080 RepID=UPI0015C3CCE8|nr:hypothetical protein [Pseudomonas sp. ABC1]QLF91878.1 hypothetical protein HW090_01125 [Pseudomonas sp. ABC1]
MTINRLHVGQRVRVPEHRIPAGLPRESREGTVVEIEPLCINTQRALVLLEGEPGGLVACISGDVECPRDG